jgi:hypothetical protein
LRRQGIEQLGQVKYASVEQSGVISVVAYPDEQVRPGLPIVPVWDESPPHAYFVPAVVPAAGIYACRRCGQRGSYDEGGKFTVCPACGHEQWSHAVIEVVIDPIDNQDRQ